MLDITTLAAWGEFIGGIAVVISLVYLASQIRQNSKLLRASTTSTTAQNQFSSNAFMVQEPEVARIFNAGMADRESLCEEDRQRFDSLLSLHMDAQLQQYEFGREGIQLSLMAERLARGLGWQVQQPGMLHWWREWKGLYPLEFRDHMERVILEDEAAG